ncbi:hypothetical protein [Marinobacterium nitratireducens]|uniref:hypothetical protein n=1 Tax=Marinobacterium nitratireducens TaxID=518897 RepID=UPI0016652362|nr:hypothetical protein [Marinobacterium nitratireducens]
MSSFAKALVFIFGVFFVVDANARLMCSLGVSPGQQYNPNYDQRPGQRASSELDTIYRALCPTGCGRYFLTSNHSTPNAMAQAIAPGESKIAYNPDFMNDIANRYGGGATFGILAHEFGHHIDFHSTPAWMNNSWSRELKADAWAGCALARVGGSTQQIENSLRAIAAYPAPTHPGWQQRHHAVRTGFTNCGGNWSSRFDFTERQPRISQPPPAYACQTGFGVCRLGQVLPAGASCSCPVFDAWGRLVRQDPGLAR